MFPLNHPLYMNGEEGFPMLIQLTKKCFNESHKGDELTNEEEVGKSIKKFYLKRKFMFSKFDEGVKLDEESWYSVIPEVLIMLIYIAHK